MPSSLLHLNDKYAATETIMSTAQRCLQQQELKHCYKSAMHSAEFQLAEFVSY